MLLIKTLVSYADYCVELNDRSWIKKLRSVYRDNSYQSYREEQLIDILREEESWLIKIDEIEL